MIDINEIHWISDSTLNLETLTCIFQDVEDWDKLGYYLDVPWSLRAKIENEHVCLGQRKSALLSEWLQSHPAPTWQLVGNALSWMGKSNIKLHTALKSVYSKYLPGKFIDLWLLIFIIQHVLKFNMHEHSLTLILRIHAKRAF